MAVLVMVSVLALLTLTGTAQDRVQSFESAGLRLQYESLGSGPPIVLISGGPGMEVDYVRPLADLLPAGYSRILLQQRGTGQSRPAMLTAENVSFEKSVEDIEALRVHLKQERLALLGHSWGGLVAMAYAGAYPTRVDHLVLMDSAGPTSASMEGMGPRVFSRLQPAERERVQALGTSLATAANPDQVRLEIWRTIMPAYFADRAQASRFAAALPANTVHHDAAQLLIAAVEKGFDLRPGLERIQGPVLILQGREDPIGEETAEQIHQLIPASKLTYVEASGHFPWLERPEQVGRALAQFLARPAAR